MTVSALIGSFVRGSNAYTGNTFYGQIVEVKGSYIVAVFDGFYPDGKAKRVRLWTQTNTAICNHDAEYYYIIVSKQSN